MHAWHARLAWPWVREATTARSHHQPYAKQLGKKFLNRARTAIEYTPMQLLLDAPLVDVGVGGGHSVPTAINADHMHFARLRLDYCLASQGLVEAAADACTLGSDDAAEPTEAGGAGDGGAGGGVGVGQLGRHGRRAPAGTRRLGRMRATPLRNARTNTLSDHFPLLVVF